MHLDHKIPWNTAAYHFSLEKSSPDYLHRHTNIYCRDLPSQANDLNHFTRVLIATIREFSITEKAKYPVSICPTPTSKAQKLFSDELLVYPERRYGLGPYERGRRTGATNPLSARHQCIKEWIKEATAGWNYKDNKPGYGEHEDLADALKMLMIIASLPSEGKSADEDEAVKRLGHEAFSAILRLSHNPKTPIHELHRLGWGGDVFGFELVVQQAFEAYLQINVVDAIYARERHAAAAAATAAITNRSKNHAGQKKPHVSLLETRSFHLWANYALEYDGSKAENIPHAAFWNTCGVTHHWANRAYFDRCHDPWAEIPSTGAERYHSVRDPLASTDADGADVQRNELKQYLKLCFGIMYRYDLWHGDWRGDVETEEMWKNVVSHYMQRSWQCAADEDKDEFVPGQYKNSYY